ncbi:uncharacterized protein [Amphiura filiformis]|uniref:uncharacterized protein n=1 Tax=Amphiura filiformis TaxID=82378 RepID=UPI003B21E4B9
MKKKSTFKMAFKHTACFVITVMIVCNAVLYPSIFSTMFRQWFGSASSEKTKEPTREPPSNDLPPHLRGRGPGGPNPRRREAVDPRRAADTSSSAFFAAGKQGAGDSRGRGLMGSILPVYAVGILLYFAYIMYKIFLKDKTPETSKESPSQKSFNEFQTQYGPTLERRKAEELQRTLSDELKGAKKKAAAEVKAAKAKAAANPAGDESEIDVAALQKRLEDTEKAMQRMMDMMNNMGVAMNQVTKQLCSDGKDMDDPGQQADDEVSDDGTDPLNPGIFRPLASTHSTDTEDEDLSNIDLIDRVPRGKEYADEDSAKCVDDDDDDEEEEEVEDIGMDSKENDTTDTVRRRNVGSNDGETVQ